MNQPSDNQLSNRQPWVKAKPATLPKPSYWPFFLAMGLAFALWGLLTSWIISAVGGVIITVSLIGWIANLRHE